MLSRTEEKQVVALRRRKARDAERLFLAEGIRGVEELLAAGFVPRLAVCSPSLEDTERGRELARRLPPEAVRRVPDAVLERVAATESPQGILIVADIPALQPDDVQPAAGALVLVLDGVQDPGNFGTLVRAADAFRATAVLALPGTVDPWNPKSVRAAAGSSYRVPILSMGTEAALDWLRRHGMTILVADAAGEPVQRLPASSRTALVVGNEGAGVSEAWRAAADAVVAVPTPGPVESLNVAVATGILLYALVENRDRTG